MKDRPDVKDRPDISDAALARLARVRDEDLTSAVTGRAAEALYQEVVSMPRQESQTKREIADRADWKTAHGGRRLLAHIALVAGAVAAVAVVAGLTGIFGSRGPVFVAPAQAIEKAAAVLAADDHTIYHFVVTCSQTTLDGATSTWTREEWSSFTGQGERSIQKDEAIPWLETSVTPDGRLQLYDSASQTIFEKATSPSDQLPNSSDGDSYRAEALRMLRSGRATVTGPMTIDGRRAVRIESDDGSMTYFVDATTYDPIRLDWVFDGKSTFRFFAYERIEETAKSLKLLDLRSAYPSASVDTDPRHYDGALARITGGEVPGESSPKPTSSPRTTP